MERTITDAANISYLEPQADGTLSTGGGAHSVAAVLIRPRKGQPGKVLRVNKNNVDLLLGKPLHKSVGAHAEQMYQLHDMLDDANYVETVVVRASDARFPVLTVANDLTVAKSNVAFGTAIVVGSGNLFAVYPVDGAVDAKRTMEVASVDATTNKFVLTLKEEDAGGVYRVLESYEVSLDPEAKDDLGLSAYLETVLETSSARFRAVVHAGVDPAAAGVVAATAFEGGTIGGDPTVDDYRAALALLAPNDVKYNALVICGIYDAAVIGEMADLADRRVVSLFGNAPSELKTAAAITWIENLGIDSYQACFSHCPYVATDEHYGGEMVWGSSGAQFAAKAIGNNQFSGSTPGVHFSPAGINRAKLNRRNVRKLHPGDEPDLDAHVTARLNPVVPCAGGVMIKDALTQHRKRDYLRFQHVGAVLNDIAHRYEEAASYAKDEPDGLTFKILNDLMTDLLDEYVTSGALVPPRNPEVDGTEPYKVVITQVDFDLWRVEWQVCITGVSRRIVGQPILIK